MKKTSKLKILIVFFALILLILGIYFIIFKEEKQQTGVENVEINKVCFKQQCFGVEIVKTVVERERGLMFRESLNSNSGMLFVFDRVGIYNFWMKNTLIPLDIIWIDENMNVVYLKENTVPCKVENCEIYIPEKEALYVLEINAGEAEKNMIKIGDEVRFIK